VVSTAFINSTLATQQPFHDRPRRRPSGSTYPDSITDHPSNEAGAAAGASSGLPARAFAQPLAAIPGTPGSTPSHTPMSLSRSPSPRPNGGWSSKGLTDEPNGRFSPSMSGYSSTDNQWAAARARSQKVRGYPTIQTKNEGFFQRSKRKISSTLPTFNKYGPKTPHDWREAEKLGRGRWYPRGGSNLGKLKTFVGNVLRRFKFFFIILAVVIITTILISKLGKSGILAINLTNTIQGCGSSFEQVLHSAEVADLSSF
jgi:mannan polymerase II complex MNN10 subunit